MVQFENGFNRKSLMQWDQSLNQNEYAISYTINKNPSSASTDLENSINTHHVSHELFPELYRFLSFS